MSDKNKITWGTLALMAFSTVWGFGNIVNGFVYFCQYTREFFNVLDSFQIQL